MNKLVNFFKKIWELMFPKKNDCSCCAPTIKEKVVETNGIIVPIQEHTTNYFAAPVIENIALAAPVIESIAPDKAKRKYTKKAPVKKSPVKKAPAKKIVAKKVLVKKAVKKTTIKKKK